MARNSIRLFGAGTLAGSETRFARLGAGDVPAGPDGEACYPRPKTRMLCFPPIRAGQGRKLNTPARPRRMAGAKGGDSMVGIRLNETGSGSLALAAAAFGGVIETSKQLVG